MTIIDNILPKTEKSIMKLIIISLVAANFLILKIKTGSQN